MRFNEKKFYELAKENYFESADLSSTESNSITVSIFHKEIDSLTQSNSYSLVARGIIDGKLGTAAVDSLNKETPEFLINTIKRTANLIEDDDPVSIYKGSDKYHKKSIFNKEILDENIKEKVKILLEIERKFLSFNSKINEVVSVGYEQSYTEIRKTNSHGLKLSQKTALYSYFAEITAKDGDEIRTSSDIFVSIDPDEFNVDSFVEQIANDALSKLGSTQCKSKKYPVVLNPESASTLLSFLISSLDAEEVQKHTSLFEGKLNQQVLSKKLTIIENPLEKNVFFRYFDDEGVATSKKYLVNKGIVPSYLYTLQTALKDNTQPTGNGYGKGKAQADVGYTFVKPGKKSEDEIFALIKEGVYITELSGLHSGMNASSGNFSLQCSGFMIRNGKKTEPLTLITVADNLINVFNNIKEIGNNSKLVNNNQMRCPSFYIKKMTISGQ